MTHRLARYFDLEGNGTTVRTEVLAGCTTFLTMSYIIFVQPAVLSGKMFGFDTGMDFGAVTVVTCLGAAFASALMGLYARYPIALAPGMGQNFFFVLTAVPAAAAAGYENAWQTALGVVFVSGLLFLALSLFRIRETLLKAISPGMKHAIAAGIGLFIAFIGLQNAGLILKSPATGVTLNPRLFSADLIVFFVGLLTAGGLHARKRPAAILCGILAACVVATGFKLWRPDSVERYEFARTLVAAPPSIAPTLLQLDLGNALSWSMLPFILVFLFMVLFDTVGTLVGVAGQAGMLQDNRLARARQAFTSDALGTTLGACLGTSTVTAYIESATGVEQGGRTGLTSVVVASLFLLALFFSPLIAMIGGYPPLTAPALVMVGVMMFANTRSIDWTDFTEALPAFAVIVGIPLCYSIGDGLALGFLCYPVVKLLTGRGREAHWFLYLLAVLIVLYFVLVRSRLGA